MKNFKYLISGLFFILFSMSLQAQSPEGIDYFKGQWKVTAEGPQGDVTMVVGIAVKESKVTGTISDADGKELYKVVNTGMKGERMILNFIGSHGSEVDMELSRKDADHLTGSIMNMYDLKGERIKAKN